MSICDFEIAIGIFEIYSIVAIGKLEIFDRATMTGCVPIMLRLMNLNSVRLDYIVVIGKIEIFNRNHEMSIHDLGHRKYCTCVK